MFRIIHIGIFKRVVYSYQNKRSYSNIKLLREWVVEMKYFIRKESDRFKIYKLSRGTRQLVSIADRAYGTDD